MDGSAVAPVAAAVADDFDTGDEVVSPKGKKGKKYSGPKGPGLGEMIAKVGGIPTILFGIGTFLVIWFTFMDSHKPGGHCAGEYRGTETPARTGRRTQETSAEGQKKRPGTRRRREEGYDDKAKKINEDYEKRIDDAKEEAATTRVDVIRSIRFDKYGQLFGFVFLAFGCLGYLRTEQPLVMRIVAASVLALMLLMIFNLAVGGCNGKPTVPNTNIKGGFEG